MRIRLHNPLGIYEIGKRQKQEDAIYPQLEQLSASSRVFVVCDGLGGLDNGEVASAAVASAMGKWVDEYLATGQQLTREKVSEAVLNAQHALEAVASGFDSEKSMGTTLTMLAFTSNGVVAAHIGDSRIYHLRPSTGQVMYRSRDHSLVNDLFLMGRLTRAEAEASPKRNILTRAMIPGRPVRADIVFIADVKPGDYFLVCSDGVCGEISDKQLMAILADESKTNSQKLAYLQMKIQGGADNRSAFLLQVDAVEKEEGDEPLVSTAATIGEKEASATEIVAASPLTVDTSGDEEQDVNEAPVPALSDDSVAPPPITPVEATERKEETVAPPPAIENAQGVVDENKGKDAHAVVASDKSNLKKGLWIVLAAVLLAAGITACFMLRKPSTPVVNAQKPDTLINPDVTIDSVLPEEPVDSMAIGTDVPVPPAPRVTSVPTPDVSYPSGSNVRVPRAERYDPYPAAFDDDDDEGYTPPVPPQPEAKVAQEQPVQQAQPSQPSQPQSSASRSVPPARSSASSDPTRSNRNVAVPPPPGKRRVTQAPY
ncbi:MAG: protein phosphatase 2C domain-containing protein [Muribaculaceae bacterium]|nr:protein phosphatase 2C domain-containing protein [Muribaculaceae bacterium]